MTCTLQRPVPHGGGMLQRCRDSPNGEPEAVDAALTLIGALYANEKAIHERRRNDA